MISNHHIESRIKPLFCSIQGQNLINPIRFLAAACKPDFVKVVQGLEVPEFSPNFANFTTRFVEFERRRRNATSWKPLFGGHQTWDQRELSFRARDAKIHCGFVKPLPGSEASATTNGTGFEIDEEDTQYMGECTLVVASAIFGDWDHLKPPLKRTVSIGF